MTKSIYLVDIGVLLENKDHPEYQSYANVYDKKHGYYDEDQYYEPNLQDAIEMVTKYVKNGVENTYGVISKTQIGDTLTDDEIREANVESETYEKTDVVFSMAKQNGKIISPLIS